MKSLFLLLIFAACCMTRAADGVFDSNGVKIRYVTEGKGEAIVLIHGWMGDSTMWGRDASGNTKLNTAGMEGFQVIAIDCRGHGKSDKPHDPAKYGVEMALDVVRLLDHLKVRKAHLVGYSMGAFIAGKVAASHPERVLSVVYGGQAPLLTGEANGSNEVEIFAKAAEEGKDLGEYILAVTLPDKPKPTMEQANVMAKFMFLGKDVKALAAAGRSFPKLAVPLEELGKGKVPTLFIYGSKEPAVLKDRVVTIRKVLSGSQLKVIEGADHITTLTKPEFGATIVEFLRVQKTGCSGRLGDATRESDPRCLHLIGPSQRRRQASACCGGFTPRLCSSLFASELRTPGTEPPQQAGSLSPAVAWTPAMEAARIVPRAASGRRTGP